MSVHSLLDSSTIKDVVVGLTTNAIWLVLGATVSWLWLLRDVFHPLRTFLSISKNVTVIIGVPFYWDTKAQALSIDSGLPLFGYGPVKTLSRLLTDISWKGVRQKLSLKVDDDFRSVTPKGHIIVLGYPDSNIVSEEIMNSGDVIVSFLGHSIRYKNLDGRTVELKPEYGADGEVIRDYGYILVGKSPFDMHGRLLLLAGGETHGLQVAEEFLADRVPVPFGNRLLRGWVSYVGALIKVATFRAPHSLTEILVSGKIRSGEVTDVGLVWWHSVR